MIKPYFIDTSYFIALVSKKDQYHDEATYLAKKIKMQRIPLITSEFILLEVGNSFSKQNFKLTGINLIHNVYDDTNIEVVKLSEKYYRLGLSRFTRELDKNWSLTDCISMEIMKDCGIDDVLTSDIHFTQAGFNRLIML